MLKAATFRQLKALHTVARLGSVSRAAEELKLTQPAVSLQIRLLEDAAGAPLLQRVGRGVQLTAAGEILARYALEILDLWNGAADDLAALHGEQGGTLRIGAITTAEYLIPPFLVRFTESRPQVKVQFKVGNRADIIRMLATHEIDLAVMGSAPRELRTAATAFAKHPMAFVASPAHALMKKKRLSLDDLQNANLFVRERGSGTRSTVENLFKLAGHKLHIGSELSSNEAIKQLVNGEDRFIAHQERQRDLPRRHAMRARHLRQHAAARACRRRKIARAERAIGGDRHPVPRAPGQHGMFDRALPQMIQHLIARDPPGTAGPRDVLQRRHIEIADAPGQDLAVRRQPLEPRHGVRNRMRARPMQQIAIQPVGAQPRQRRLARADRALPRRIAGQHLGNEEHAVALPGDRVGHDRLGAAIHLRRIDMGHAKLDAAPERRNRPGLALTGLVTAHLPRALPDHRHIPPGRPEHTLPQGAASAVPTHSRQSMISAAMIAGPRNSPSKPHTSTPPRMPSSTQMNGSLVWPPISTGRIK